MLCTIKGGACASAQAPPWCNPEDGGVHSLFLAATNTVFSRSEVFRVRAIFLPHSVLWRRNVLADELEPSVPTAQRALKLLGRALQMEPDAILTP